MRGIAKRFFYASGGLLMLAIAYHLGASSAQGQTVGGLECADVDGTYEEYGVVNRQLYRMTSQGPVEVDATSPVPGTAKIVACGPQGIVLETGEVMVGDGSGGWKVKGIFPVGGAVSARGSSWGALKARYR